MFGRSKTRVPRWGFTAGWADFVVAIRGELAGRGVTVGEDLPAHGVVPLPADAAYEAWDLRPLARCRELDPGAWSAAISAMPSRR